MLAMKRIINILPRDMKEPVSYSGGIDMLRALVKRDEGRLGFSSDLFEGQSESDFFGEASKNAGVLIKLIDNKEFNGIFSIISRIVPAVDGYFDAVLVNCDDEAVRANRHRFLSSLRAAFGIFCDFSVVAGE